MDIKNTFRKIKDDIPALYLSLKDKETPLFAKIMAILTVGYALSPIDLIPDFIPFLGYLDDILLLPIMIILTVKLIPKKVWNRCLENAKEIWENGWPKRWYLSAPVVIIWIIIILLISQALFNNNKL